MKGKIPSKQTWIVIVICNIADCTFLRLKYRIQNAQPTTVNLSFFHDGTNYQNFLSDSAIEKVSFEACMQISNFSVVLRRL